MAELPDLHVKVIPDMSEVDKAIAAQKPSVGRVVHYVSYGTPVRPDGSQAFTAQCRAAIITETAEQMGSNAPDVVGLAVLNPDGLFFHPLSKGGCRHEDVGDADHMAGGTWHWPERVS
jgi:hypothetical protein